MSECECASISHEEGFGGGTRRENGLDGYVSGVGRTIALSVREKSVVLIKEPKRVDCEGVNWCFEDRRESE